MGFGVEDITVTATQTARLTHEQSAWRSRQRVDGEGQWGEVWGDHEASGAVIQRAMGELIDTLVHRLGMNHVRTVTPMESHVPERITQWQHAAAKPPMGHDAKALVEADRPTLLFDRPMPVDVMALSPDGPVMRVIWRGVEQGILTTLGPERIAPPWWRESGSATRDYFKVQAEGGRWLWMFREVETGRWFVQGVWS
jgi:protein ImuB